MSKITSDSTRIGRWLIMALVAWPLISTAMETREYLDDARGYFDKGDYRTAVIQLKNALQADPDNKDARLLLGRTYLKLEDGPSALKELNRARDLGVGRETWLIPLGRAYLMTGQNDQLLQELTPVEDDPLQTRIDILLLHGQTYLEKQDFAMADERFTEALELQPTLAGALAGKARIAFLNRDLLGAASLADRAIASDDQIVDAWIVKGELFHEAGTQREAISAFQKALDIAPANIPARLGKALSLVTLGENDNARVEIDRLLERYPNYFMAHYLKALILYQQQQLTQAQESIQLALKLAPDHPASLLLSGTINYQQGQLHQTEQHLRQYMRLRPDNKQAAKVLAATLLKLKKPSAAIEVLEPGMPSAADDVQYLSLLGGAYLAQGEAGRGLDYLEKAIALAPDSANIRTQLALGHLVLGEGDQAINELETAVGLDRELLQADALLVMTYLRKQDFDNALVAVKALMEKMPDSPVPDNMEGAAYFGKGDYRAARKSYEAALHIQPDFAPAHLNLAQLDLLANDPATAKEHYRQVLAIDEGNLKALLGLAVMANHEKQADETERWLKQAHHHHPEAIQPALMLVEYYQRQGKALKSLDIARKMAVTYPRDQQVLKTLALSQLKAGEDKAALTTLYSLVEAAPQSPEARYQMGLTQLKLGQTDAARESFQQAVSLQSDYPTAQLALGRLTIAAKDFDEALNIATNIKKAHPDIAEGYELEGDVRVAQQAFEQAVKTYATAYEKASSAQLARKIFWSKLQTGDADAAREVLRNWLGENPDDSATRTLLASHLQQAGQRQLAIDEFLKVLENEPDNVMALNNVAWLYQEAGKSEGIQYAERAHELVPDRPDVTDTLGWLLVQNGNINRGLVLLQEARMKAPHIPDIHYHMAAALHKSGRTDEARKELDRLFKTGKTFPEMNNAMALRDLLSND